nr:uncharacterized protein LOC104086921 [Nicotiana tomentosiformis]
MFEEGLVVDYPNSDQYELVTVGKLAKQEAYIFHIFSSEGSGVWHEFQFSMKFFDCLALIGKPVYVHNSLHWLRVDGRVLGFDTKREEAKILDLPEFISHQDSIRRKYIISPGSNTWLGMTQGLLTLVYCLNKSIVIATYDYVSNNWRVSDTMDNFMKAPNGCDYRYGFPIWIDSGPVLFLGEDRFLYEHDSKMSRFKITAVFDKHYMIYHLLCRYFEPSLANVQKTPSDIVRSKHLSAVTATLDELKCFITEGTN